MGITVIGVRLGVRGQIVAVAILASRLHGQDQHVVDRCKSAGSVTAQIQACRGVVAAMPARSATHHNLGRALASAGRDSEAIVEFRRAIHLDDKNTDAYVALSSSLSAIGAFDEALVAGYTAVRKGPATAETYRVLGQANLGLKRFDAALLQLNEAVRISPRDASLRSQRAVALHALGRFADALASFAAAAKQDSTVAIYYGGLAMSALALRNPGVATAAWAEAQRRDPNYFAHNVAERVFHDEAIRQFGDVAPDRAALLRIVAAGDRATP